MPAATLRPPDGWSLDQSPTVGRAGHISRDTGATLSRDNIEERYIALRDWATSNGLQLEPEDYSLVEYAQYLDVYFWTKFKVTRSSSPSNENVIAAFPCTGCGVELKVGQVYCERCDRFVVCDTCHLAGLRLYGVRGQEGNGACPACSVECASSTCHSRLAKGDGFDKCAECDPRAGCAHCARMVPMAQLVEHTHTPPNALAAAQGSFYICPSCVSRVCGECDGHFDNTQDRTIGGETVHICDACAQVRYDKERVKFERWEADELPVSGSLLIPGTASRPIRTISVETEFDGDGVKVGRALASAGLIAVPDRDRYSSQGDSTGRYPCILKSDASVTGGELVTYLIDLDNDNHAAALLRVTEVMRGCRELGQAQFTHRAGGHVHVDLHGLTARDLWAQYTIFNHLQLVIFYLAGAGAEYGHRTLSGSGYSDAGPVGPFGTVGKFAQQVLQAGDRYALHFGNFNQSKNKCQCGAFVTGEWSTCKRPSDMLNRRGGYEYEDLLACGRGEMFGPGNAQLPLPPMLMFDRISEISETGGEYGKGVVRAELDVKPDLWFFGCHFKNDPVMPGCLGLDALWQMIGFYLGWTGGEGRGRALGLGELKLAGQVMPNVRKIVYNVDIKRVMRLKLWLGIADGWLSADGEIIYRAKDLRVGLLKQGAALQSET